MHACQSALPEEMPFKYTTGEGDRSVISSRWFNILFKDDTYLGTTMHFYWWNIWTDNHTIGQDMYKEQTRMGPKTNKNHQEFYKRGYGP